jgi:hypothetical protein
MVNDATGGDTKGAHEFISPDYVNRESKHKDSHRSQLKGPEEFIDTVKNLRGACPDLHIEVQETGGDNKRIKIAPDVTNSAMQTAKPLYI